MQSLREAASNLSNKRKTSLSRVSYVQAILESVQVIRKSEKSTDVCFIHIQLFTVFLHFLALV